MNKSTRQVRQREVADERDDLPEEAAEDLESVADEASEVEDAEELESPAADPELESALEADEAALTPSGEELSGELGDPEPFEIAADEDEAEELSEFAEDEDETPGEADPDDVVIDDEDQLDAATEEARKAKSSRPVKRTHTQAPIKKATPTRKRDPKTDEEEGGVGPVTFTRQSVGELKKVVWPSGDDVKQYFLVVLVFVLIIMGIVFGLDTLFGWGLLKLLG
jgi:preprotein translocase subunit SecE